MSEYHPSKSIYQLNLRYIIKYQTQQQNTITLILIPAQI